MAMSQNLTNEWKEIQEKRLLAGFSPARLLKFTLCPRKWFQDNVYVPVGTGKFLLCSYLDTADN